MLYCLFQYTDFKFLCLNYVASSLRLYYVDEFCKEPYNKSNIAITVSYGNKLLVHTEKY